MIFKINPDYPKIRVILFSKSRVGRAKRNPPCHFRLYIIVFEQDLTDLRKYRIIFKINPDYPNNRCHLVQKIDRKYFTQ